MAGPCHLPCSLLPAHPSDIRPLPILLVPCNLPGMRYGIIKTSAGLVGVADSGKGLRRLTLPRTSENAVLQELGVEVTEGSARDDGAFETIVRLLRRYFEGESVDFSGVALDLEGMTAFRRRVLENVRAIPRGQVRTYGEVAAGVDRPGAARAVGGVMAANPVCIVIPCHRVVASDGGLGGFGGGLEMKESMLAMEGAFAAA